jgi:hypothetical protein
VARGFSPEEASVDGWSCRCGSKVTRKEVSGGDDVDVMTSRRCITLLHTPFPLMLVSFRGGWFRGETNLLLTVKFQYMSEMGRKI